MCHAQKMFNTHRFIGHQKYKNGKFSYKATKMHDLFSVENNIPSLPGFEDIIFKGEHSFSETELKFFIVIQAAKVRFNQRHFTKK